MGKITKGSGKRSIKKDFAMYLLCYVLGALAISLLCCGLLQYAQSKVPKEYLVKYIEDGAVHQASVKRLEEEELEISDEALRVERFVGENGSLFYLNYYAPDIRFSFDGFNGILYEILGVASGVVYPVVFVMGIGIASRSFYKRKLQEPLEILDRAADNISNQDLDFEISYKKQDELGKLCASFEKMRHALQDNNREMWRQIEERRRLNAAFSHDLRTPLTVLKGQSEMLLKYAPEMPDEKIEETAEMMRRHIVRLENYVNTMGDLQRLEDREVKRQKVEPAELVKQLRETGDSACGVKKFLIKTDIQNTKTKEAVKWELDISIVMEVYENLLANAVRYARDVITVSLSVRQELFLLTVTDDGGGFSKRDLVEAVKPFYKAEGETNDGHFGMGLNICKVLCEKHGGYLELKNEGGASVTAAFG